MNSKIKHHFHIEILDTTLGQYLGQRSREFIIAIRLPPCINRRNYDCQIPIVRKITWRTVLELHSDAIDLIFPIRPIRIIHQLGWNLCGKSKIIQTGVTTGNEMPTIVSGNGAGHFLGTIWNIVLQYLTVTQFMVNPLMDTGYLSRGTCPA